ncbi:MAG TPA: outer membrane beta-barrel protein [Burkholderiales bacterium]|nr:outer membrane beta-barrel protein [Burkholderiales bacterium]
MPKIIAQCLTAGAIALAVAGAGPAYAQTSSTWMGGRMDTSLYIGGNVGQSMYRHTCDSVPVSCDDKDIGWRVFAGWRFHPNFALETGFFHLGEASASGFGITADAKVRGWELVGVASIPVWQQLSLFAKAGYARSRVSVNGFGAGLAVSARENSNDFTYGVGAEYAVARNLGARLEWQRYDGVGGSTTGKDDIDLLSLGVLYRF